MLVNLRSNHSFLKERGQDTDAQGFTLNVLHVLSYYLDWRENRLVFLRVESTVFTA